MSLGAGGPRSGLPLPAGGSDRYRITRDEHDLLTFAISWLPYGCGPEDEILINFGLTRQRYLERLQDVVERLTDRLHPDTTRRLLQMCQSNSHNEWNPRETRRRQSRTETRK